ncbi:MAG: murein biosynthesis integral membrane protein MurJ [Verrucomicrobia bacterium]|nr:murein biosynthesis integral membrane protein MurJ [Verrucomicrobiota bacterium]
MSQMLKSSGAMGAATLTSRVLGMVREIVYANFMGAGPVASAFVLAFQIPSLFRRLLGEGALTAAFIPVFKEKEKTAGEPEMWRAANAVISGLTLVSVVIIALVVAGISVALTVGVFTDKTRLMLQLLRVMFPYMLLVCIAATYMGMLNARGHFFIPAMGATMLNLVMIASVLWLAPMFGHTLETQIFGLAFGVLLAGSAQAFFQVPVLKREGYRFEWVRPWPNETVRLVLVRMLPGTIGVAAFQLNVVLTQSLAFWVGDSIVASFNYAVRLMELPQGVFGISLATYLLPTLSGLAAERKYADFRATLKQSLGYLAFVNLLASALLVALAEPIIRLLFERGEFSAWDTHAVAWALQCLAPGLVAFSTVNILARAFYALGDTTTPMKVSAFCLGLNLVFVFFLVRPFEQGGLGIANTLSAVFNVGLLGYALRRKLKRLDLVELPRVFSTVLAAALLAGLIAWLTYRGWERGLGHARLTTRLGAVFVPMGVATAAYAAMTLATRVPQAQDLLDLVREKLWGRRGSGLDI